MQEDFNNNENLNQLEEDDFYLTSEGYKVFTKKYHLKRGYCCKSNCRHCPFDFKNQNK